MDELNRRALAEAIAHTGRQYKEVADGSNNPEIKIEFIAIGSIYLTLAGSILRGPRCLNRLADAIDKFRDDERKIENAGSN